MHPSSLDNMQRCIDRYLDERFLAGRESLCVLDVGGENVNGGYRDLFVGLPGLKFIAADLRASPDVDVVLENPDRLPFPDHSFDVVISGQMLEHCPHFWLVFQEMSRVQRKDGLLFLIAPSAGPIHRYPTDCYRFYPDAFAALAELAGGRLVDCWLDERGPWRDLTGVFARTDHIQKASAARVKPRVALAVPRYPDPLAEVTRGAQSYLETLRLAHERLRPELYMEIGIRRGDSLRLAQAAAIGIDPFPELAAPLPPSLELVEATSDDYFAEPHAQRDRRVDLAFIDGMHLFEYALRDFINLERRAGPASVIILDDVFPNHPLQANRDRVTASWSGDIWKLSAILSATRPDLVMIPLDAAPCGLLLVTALDPKSTKLLDSYNPIVRGWQRTDRSVVPPRILRRTGAMSPLDPRLALMMDSLRMLRMTDASQIQVSETVKAQLAQTSPDLA